MNAVAGLKLCDLMSCEVLAVSVDCSLEQAFRGIAGAQTLSLLVMQEEDLLGIVTDHDVVQAIFQGADLATPVSEVMSSPVYAISLGTSVREAAAFLVKHRIRHLPVVDDDGRVLGIVTQCGLLQQLGNDLVREGSPESAIEPSLSGGDGRYRLLFESAGDAILVLGHHKIVDCNEKALELFRVSKQQIVGLAPGQISPIEQSDGSNSEDVSRAKIDAALDGIPQLFECRCRRADGSEFDSEISLKAVKINGETLVQAIVRDVSERVRRRRMFEDEIKHLAFYDPLTGLANRTYLLDRLRQALAVSARNIRQGALLFIDLDNFKTLNDTLGHDQGDRLLQQVAQRLADCVRESDTIARFGGDEFVVMLEGLSDLPLQPATQAKTVGEKILAAFNQPYTLAGHEHLITPSIGVTLFMNHRDTMDELLKQADLAMYQAKAAGRNALRFFDPSMQAALEARAALEAELRSAVREHQFLLYYQPQVDHEGRIAGVEALLRWQHPQRGLLLPATFISLAEDTGLIRPLGHWVLEVACRQLAIWQKKLKTSRLTIAVNVSARQFRQSDFVDQVKGVLSRTGADPRTLKLELTESVLLDDAADAIAKMTTLKSQGVSFCLDDFGTGYSSLAYLKQLPLDELKIAQSFVRDVLSDPNDAAIARTILSLGQTFGLAVIAEGVETHAQRDFLACHGCTAYQGYLFGCPGPLEALWSIQPSRSAKRSGRRQGRAQLLDGNHSPPSACALDSAQYTEISR